MLYEKDNKEKRPLMHYTPLYEALDPREVEGRCNLRFDAEQSEFSLKFMHRAYRIGFPRFYVKPEEESDMFSPLEAMPAAQLLVMRYLIEGRFVKAEGRFLTFREVPWGAVYTTPFDGRCIKRLAFTFGNKPEDFKRAMESISATPLKMGDISYEFELLEGLRLQFILWQGDDEFLPSAQILFSDNFPMAFTAEDMAVSGDVTIGSLKAIANQLRQS
jgi:hypothetical protein